jgi:hypothetical protein
MSLKDQIAKAQEEVVGRVVNATLKDQASELERLAELFDEARSLDLVVTSIDNSRLVIIPVQYDSSSAFDEELVQALCDALKMKEKFNYGGYVAYKCSIGRLPSYLEFEVGGINFFVKLNRVPNLAGSLTTDVAPNGNVNLKAGFEFDVPVKNKSYFEYRLFLVPAAVRKYLPADGVAFELRYDGKRVKTQMNVQRLHTGVRPFFRDNLPYTKGQPITPVNVRFRVVEPWKVYELVKVTEL